MNFWKPPANRNPEAEELDLCRPFVDRMIALGKPKLIIATGAVSAKALLGESDGIMKLRGNSYTLPVAGGPSGASTRSRPGICLKRTSV